MLSDIWRFVVTVISVTLQYFYHDTMLIQTRTPKWNLFTDFYFSIDVKADVT